MNAEAEKALARIQRIREQQRRYQASYRARTDPEHIRACKRRSYYKRKAEREAEKEVKSLDSN